MARKLPYFFRETGIALRRNGLVTFAAISTVFISLFLVGASLLVQKQVDLWAGFWGDKVEVSVFLREDASSEEIQALGRNIGGMPEVERVFYESNEQAYVRFQELFEQSEALVRNVGPDSLPASFRVKLKDPERFPVIRARLAGEPAIDEIRDERQILNGLLSVTAILRTGALAVAAIMLVAAAGLIGNTVRLGVFARRKEIGIMKLVGATNWFIRIPFLIEGIIQGVIGALAAVLALFVGKVWFIDPLRNSETIFGLTRWVDTSNILFPVVPVVLVSGILIAAVASLFAMRRFLEV